MSEVELPLYPGIGLERIVLVDSEALAEVASAALLAADVIGLDTESKPTFLKGEESTGPHLIQLATDERAYLFPVSPTYCSPVLKTILESPRVLKAGMGLGNDRSALKSRLGIELKHVLDLGEALRGRGEGRIGHRGTVGAKDESVTTQVLAAPEDAEDLIVLTDELVAKSAAAADSSRAAQSEA